MNIMAFNQLCICTTDRKYTQRDLIRKIKEIATSKGCDNTVANSVINSFVTDGIMETYNELGYQRWIKMIHQMIDHEYTERKLV